MDKATIKKKFVDSMMELHDKLWKRKYKIAKNILEELNDELDIWDTGRENKSQERRNQLKNEKLYIEALVNDILDNYPEDYTGNDPSKIEYKKKVDAKLIALESYVDMTFWEELKTYCEWS